MNEQQKATQQLKELSAFDNAMRKAIVSLLGHYPMTKTMLAASFSAMAWQLRMEITSDQLRQTEIMAQYICTTRSIEDYPLAGLRE